MMWRRIRMFGAAGAAVAVMAACAGEGAPSSQAAQRPLKVVGQFELHSLDPSTSGGFFTRLQVAETLVDADLRGALQPGLATSWEVSPDGLTWRFALRPDAAFHDGTAVTAVAVADALETARTKAGTPLATVPVEAIAADGGEVRVDLAKPFAPLAAVLAHTSTQILAPGSYGPDRAVTKVIGSGPYRVERLEQPATIELTAFEQWQGNKPAITRGGVPGRRPIGKPGADGRERPGRRDLRHGPDQPAAPQTGGHAGHRRCHPPPHHPAQGQRRPRHPR